MRGGMIIKKFIKSTFEGEYTDAVTLTMTCSKRLHLFKQTLPSFVENCTDIPLISKIILFDDSSSADDRFEMEKLVEGFFPNVNIDFVYFDNILTKYRHAYIMQHWFDMVKSNFVFHLEDDWKFIHNFSLKKSIELLKNDWNVMSVTFAQSLREFPSDYIELYKATDFGRDKEILYPKDTNYWIWPFVDTKNIGDLMFYDTVRCREGSTDYNCNYWEYFINYPPFGFQPGVIDVTKLKMIGNFDIHETENNTPINIEGSHGMKVYKHFYAVCSLKRKVVHIGSNYLGQSSAYDLNQSSR